MPVFVVQGAGRFVAQQQFGFLGDGAGDRDALLLAAGQLRGEVVEPVGKPHLAEGVGRVKMVGADLGGELHVLKRGQVGHQVVELEDEADVVAAVADQLLGSKAR